MVPDLQQQEACPREEEATMKIHEPKDAQVHHSIHGHYRLVKLTCGWLYVLSATCVVLLQLRLSLLASGGRSRSPTQQPPRSLSDDSNRKFLLQVDNDSSKKLMLDDPSIASSSSLLRTPSFMSLNQSISSSRKFHAVHLLRNGSSSTAKRNVRNGSKRPVITLIAGPYKTGSSFLQCAFSQNGYDLLQLDNHFYLGTCSFECRRPQWNYDFCEKHSQGSFFRKNKVDPFFQDKLDELYSQGRNAIIVWEYLSDLSDERMMNLMAALDGWDIRVILMYRRLFAWLPSWYGQKHRPIAGREHMSAWPGEPVLLSGKQGRARGVFRYPFDMYTSEQRKSLKLDGSYHRTMNLIETTSLHPVEQARRHWRKYVSNVTVVSLHHIPNNTGSGDPLFTHLFCTVMPLNNTCRAARANLVDHLEEGSNERFPENYDLLAVYAHQLGLHPEGAAKMTRRAAWRKVQQRQEEVLNKTSSDFALRCMSASSLETLLNLSITSERSLLPNLEEEHKLEFFDAVRKNKFCSVDPNRTLEHEDWRDYFQPFVSIVPHIAVRNASGHWTPEWKPRFSLQQLYFSDFSPLRQKPIGPQVEFIGVFGGEMTESSLLHDFFIHHQMKHYSYFLERDAVNNAFVDNRAIDCIYGPALAKITQAHHMTRSCRVLRYSQLLKSWSASLPRIADSLPSQVAATGVTADMKAALTPVMVVRDPLERWISCFNNVRNGHVGVEEVGEILSNLASTKDLEGFLQHLSSLPFRRRELEALDQYQYIAGNIDRAIDMIDGSTPRILVLLHDCWDLSLKLLSTRFPKLISPATNELPFVHATSNATKVFPAGRSTEFTGNNTKLDLKTLRMKARVWFSHDYQFYDAAVSRFTMLVRTSQLTNEGSLSCVSWS